MNTTYNNSLSFSGVNIKIPQNTYISKEGVESWGKLIQAKSELARTRFWDLIVDEEGFKLAYKNTDNTYTIEHNPKRHAPNVLLIRTLNTAHKIKGKVTSFRVDFNNMAEVQDAYKKITKAVGIDRMVMIVKLLEKQAQNQAARRQLRTIQASQNNSIISRTALA
ncbi:hypothetical protein IKP85_01930 [bacterium]|nr:hypothetical protein [bacterium]